jgi:hypothetical protein
MPAQFPEGPAHPSPAEAAPKEAKHAALSKREASLESAKGQFCVWHAWRPAYAICNYCHRPFCYEDIEEFNNGYYCLEDIDRVSMSHAENVYSAYSNMSFVASAMLMLAFVIFVLSANAQLAFVVNAAKILGARAFVATLNASYLTLLVEFALLFVSLVVSVMIVMQSRRAYALGMIACVGDIVLFSYLFLGSGTLYIAVISVASFIGLIALAYSRVTYSAYEETPFAENNPILLAGAQRF